MTGFFRSRWIQAPDHVQEASGGLPTGFRASGVECGIKDPAAPDLGLLGFARAKAGEERPRQGIVE